MRLRKRFLLLYTLILIAFQALAIILIGSILQKRTLHSIRIDYQRDIYFLEQNTSKFLDSVEQDLLFLVNHPYVRYKDDSSFTSFLGADESTFQYDYSADELRIIELFSNYRASHPYVNSVYMGRDNGSFVRSHPRSRSTDYDPRVRPWYVLSQENPDKVVRTDIYSSVTTNDMNIGTVKALVDENGICYGAVGIDTTLTNLYDFFKNFHFSNDYYSEMFILDKNSTVILSNRQEFQNNNFANLFPEIYESLQNGMVDEIYLAPREKSSYFFTYSEKLGWYLGGIIPEEEITRIALSDTFRILVWEGFAIILLGALFLYFSDTYIIKRIQKLHDDVNLLRSGMVKGTMRLPVIKDEISLLGNSFIQMYNDWQDASTILLENQSGMIYCLGNLAETRDPETGNHILRTQHYVRLIAENLSLKEKYKDSLPQGTIEMLCTAAPLHDIGKIGIPDKILLKPGKLTPEEFNIMKKHTTLGHRALNNIIGEKSSKLFSLAAELALTHHERWDGTGYPQGLAGEDIPLSGRIMALADMYDALSTARVYKTAFSPEKTREIILTSSGTSLDPGIVDIFREHEEDFLEISRRYADERDHAAG